MKLVIAGGGTGGHLFPGVALASEFQRLAADVEVVFIGADRGLETRVVPALGYELVTLPVRGVVGHGFFGGVARGTLLVAACFKAFRILGRLKPDLVLGVGGYASVPAVLAAAARGLPRSILEQNVSPGRANQVLARFVHRIYQGFASRSEVFPVEKTRVTGNPIRPEVLPAEGLIRPSGRRTGGQTHRQYAFRRTARAQGVEGQEAERHHRLLGRHQRRGRRFHGRPVGGVRPWFQEAHP